jgi:hypothetical protein
METMATAMRMFMIAFIDLNCSDSYDHDNYKHNKHHHKYGHDDNKYGHYELDEAAREADIEIESAPEAPFEDAVAETEHRRDHRDYHDQCRDLAHVFVTKHKGTRGQGAHMCAKNDARLAAVTAKNIHCIVKKLRAAGVRKPVYIGSWNGDKYRGAPIALFSGRGGNGAIAGMAFSAVLY